MLGLGFKQSQGDHTLFIHHTVTGMIIVLLVYVDNIIVTRNNLEGMDRLRVCLTKEFEIKEMGKLKYFLGKEVARSKAGIFISQHKYVLDLLKETGLLEGRTADTPIEKNHRIGADLDIGIVDKGSYQRLVERLIYLLHTRPNIVYAVSVAS